MVRSLRDGSSGLHRCHIEIRRIESHFVAVNLQESSDEIRTFLSDKQLSPRVALDRSSAVAPTFQVSGIPHTVILGLGNIIEDVHIGYQPGSGETMQTTLQQMLDGTWKRATDETPAD